MKLPIVLDDFFVCDVVHWLACWHVKGLFAGSYHACVPCGACIPPITIHGQLDTRLIRDQILRNERKFVISNASRHCCFCTKQLAGSSLAECDSSNLIAMWPQGAVVCTVPHISEIALCSYGLLSCTSLGHWYLMGTSAKVCVSGGS